VSGTLREGGQTGKRDKGKRFGQRKRERDIDRQTNSQREKRQTERDMKGHQH